LALIRQLENVGEGYSTRPHKQTVEFQWTDVATKPGTTSYYYVRGLQVGQTEQRTVGSPAVGRTTGEVNNGEIVWGSPMWITYKPK